MGSLWPWSKERIHKRHLSFLIRCTLALAELSLYQEKCHCSPPLLITQSNHSLPTSSRVVQVAQLWEETEALLASINVLITTLMWCSPDNKEACAHQSAGKWRRRRSTQAPCASTPSWDGDISTSNRFYVLYKCCRCLIIGTKAALWGLSWINLVGNSLPNSLLAAASSDGVK